MPKPNDVGVGAAVAIINEQRQILFLQRKGAHAAGKWSFPGGWVDRADQKLLETVQREALEEVGISITHAEQVGATTEDHPDLQMRTITVYYICYPNNWTGTPTIKEPNKCSALRWCDLNHLPEETELFPALIQGIQFVQQNLQGDK